MKAKVFFYVMLQSSFNVVFFFINAQQLFSSDSKKTTFFWQINALSNNRRCSEILFLEFLIGFQVDLYFVKLQLWLIKEHKITSIVCDLCLTFLKRGLFEKRLEHHLSVSEIWFVKQKCFLHKWWPTEKPTLYF